MPAPASARESVSIPRVTLQKRLKHDVIYAIVAVLIGLLTRLPRGLTELFCRALGALAYVALGSAAGRRAIPADRAHHAHRHGRSEARPMGEAELMARLARALEERIQAWPEAWLGLFVKPRLRAADVPR